MEVSAVDDNKSLDAVNRPITEQEGLLIKWLLKHGVPGSEEFISQLDSLTVIWKCRCGCPTVNFALRGESVRSENKHILADYLATVDGQDVGVILFQREGRLSSLEVYSHAGTDKPFGLPEIEALYPWEELSQRQAKRSASEFS
jgi:hypothetical protein